MEAGTFGDLQVGDDGYYFSLYLQEIVVSRPPKASLSLGIFSLDPTLGPFCLRTCSESQGLEGLCITQHQLIWSAVFGIIFSRIQHKMESAVGFGLSVLKNRKKQGWQGESLKCMQRCLLDMSLTCIKVKTAVSMNIGVS